MASLCSLGQVLMLPAVWQGGRRVESWTAWRKLRFSMTALIFLAFGVILLLWGALQPWSARTGVLSNASALIRLLIAAAHKCL